MTKHPYFVHPALQGVLVQSSTSSYTLANGDIVTETLEVYQAPSFAQRATTTKTGYKTTKLTRSGVGELMIIQLEVEFEIDGDIVTIPRYDSSYTIFRDDLIVSYEETDMDYDYGGTSGWVKTWYDVEYVAYVNGATSHWKPTLKLTCSGKTGIIN